MIVNNLMLKIKDPADIDKVCDELLSMRGNVPMLADIIVGRNFRDTGYDFIMVAKYDSMADYEAYITDPFHQQVSKNIGDLIEGRASVLYQE